MPSFRPKQRNEEAKMERFDLVKRNKSPELLGIPCVPISKRSGVSHWALLPHSRLSSPPFPIHFLSLQRSDGFVALHAACNFGRLECAKALLGAGADINKLTNNGSTPLMKAAYYGKIEVVRELLKRGAKKELKNKDGKTAYDMKFRNTEEIKALLS